MRTSSASSRSLFHWQPFLILLPVFVLAAVGLWFLRQDRALAEQEARDRAQLITDRLLYEFGPALGFHLEEAPSRTGAEPTNAPGTSTRSVELRLDAQESLLEPPPLDPSFPQINPPPVELLPEDLAALWQAAQLREASDPDKAKSAYEQFLAAEPLEPFHSMAAYALALLEVRGRQTNAALALLEPLARWPGTVRTETGQPLAPLAALRQLELIAGQAKPDATNALQEPLDRFCSNALHHPSFLTLTLLRRAAVLAHSISTSPFDSWRLQWESDEFARAFHKALTTQWPSELSRPDAFWIEWESRPWLVVLDASGQSNQLIHVRAFPESRVQRALASLLHNSPVPVAGYFSVSVRLRDHLVLPAEREAEKLAGSVGAWALNDASLPGLEIGVHLADRAALYSNQRKRTWWILGLVILATGAALAGVVAAARAVRQQQRLAELKSNFVSSVSHELRAPIASVRLLAEGLDRGRITDPDKQRQYFRFIVQECRRLSALIQNVLDFSRIDQGRKEYDFEPTDLPGLVRETVAMMEPSARESGVRLVLHSPFPSDSSAPADANPQPILDGRALRQALINLIDNAVKHSPREAAVTVGFLFSPAGHCCHPKAGPNPATDGERTSLDQDPAIPEGWFRLWVEDQGPGIPAEEHGRIFDWFYRRGSELRRETQGVGIGLCIVKHITQAHGGRIRLTSAVGKGSRFTLELPVYPDGTNGTPQQHAKA